MPQRTLPGVINVPGVGPVNFPTTMSDDEVTAACAKLHADNQGIGDKLIGDEQANVDPRAAFGRNALNDAGNVASNLWGAAKGVGGFLGQLVTPPTSVDQLKTQNADLLSQAKNAATGLAGVPGHIVDTFSHLGTSFQQRPISTMMDASVVADPLASVARGAGRVADYVGAGLTRSAVGSEISDAALQALRDTKAVPGAPDAVSKLEATATPMQQAMGHELANSPAHRINWARDMRNTNRLIRTEKTGTAAGDEAFNAATKRIDDFISDPNISREVTPPPLTDAQIGQFIRDNNRVPSADEITPAPTRQMLRVPMPTLKQTYDRLVAKSGDAPAGAAAAANAADLRTILDKNAPTAMQLGDNAAPYLEARDSLLTSPRIAKGLEHGAGARDMADSVVGAGLLFHMLHPAQAMGYMGLRAAAKAPALKGALGQGLYDASQVLTRPGPNLGVVQGADILHDAMQDNGTKNIANILDDWWSPRPQQP